MKKKDRIAMIVHRYGKEINGGAEDHCRLLALHLLCKYSVDILTSCSKGIGPWDNHYKVGEEVSDGINVIRFKVEEPTSDPCGLMEKRGPYCPSFEDYIVENHDQYIAMIFITYSQYLSYIGFLNGFDNAIFIPTAHDEDLLRNKEYKNVFKNVKGFLYNSIEERSLIESIYDVSDIPSRTTCFGLDIGSYSLYPNKPIDERYIIYAGRVSSSKNFMELNDFFLRYKKRNRSDLKLIVIGKIDNYMTLTHHDDIIFKGFVSDEEKKQLIQNALFLVLPSLTESLSIVLLETFACKRPALVNGLCDVLKGQCERSNGGLYYTDYYEFEAEMNYLLENPFICDEMGKNGYEYVEKNYTWEKVVENVVSLIDELSDKTMPIPSTRKEIENIDSFVNIKNILEKIREKKIKGMMKFPKDRFVEKLVETALHYDKLIIVGAGNYGKSLDQLLTNKGIRTMICYADNDHRKLHGFDDKRVVSLEEAADLYPDGYFIVTPKYHMIELIDQLLGLKISLKQIGYYLA